MARSKDTSQLDLFAEPVLPPRTWTYKELLLEQIIRDTKTLMEDEEYWEPGEDFYLERIVSFRQAYNEAVASEV